MAHLARLGSQSERRIRFILPAGRIQPYKKTQLVLPCNDSTSFVSSFYFSHEMPIQAIENLAKILSLMQKEMTFSSS